MWQEITLILRKMMSLYNELLNLSKQKKAIIVSAKINDLNEIVKREQLIISVIGKLEQKRESVLTSILVKEKITKSKLEFSELLQYCDPKVGEELTAIQEATKKLLNELTVKNKENSVLLENALEFVNFNINILSKAEIGPTYGASNNSEQPQQVVINRSIFDQKI